MKHWPLGLALMSVSVVGALLTGAPRIALDRSPAPEVQPAALFWTTPGLEPDTCVAGWVLSRVIEPGAEIRIAESCAVGTPFDLQSVDLSRQPGESVSDLIARRHEVTNPFALRLVSVARELELNPWTTNDDPFFTMVRAGLADVLNRAGTDSQRMAEALLFLDRLSTKPGPIVE